MQNKNKNTKGRKASTPAMTGISNDELFEAVQKLNRKLAASPGILGAAQAPAATKTAKAKVAGPRKKGPLEKAWCKFRHTDRVRCVGGKSHEEQAEYNLLTYGKRTPEEIAAIVKSNGK